MLHTRGEWFSDDGTTGLLDTDGGWLVSVLRPLRIGPSDKKSGKLLEEPTSLLPLGKSNGNLSGRSKGRTGEDSLVWSWRVDVKSKGISDVRLADQFSFGNLKNLIHINLKLNNSVI